MTLNQLRDQVKAWWPVACIVGGLIVLWGNLPGRVAKAEEQIDDLKGWAKELQGYTRAMQEQQQQRPNQMQVIPAPQQRPRVQEWQDADGRWWCCDPNRDDCRRNDAWYTC